VKKPGIARLFIEELDTRFQELGDRLFYIF
jgi:hypothetical protein